MTRRQLRACGIAKHDLDRMLRRRELTRVHPGVFVNHTGPLTHRQRAWAAVLYAEPSALFLESAADPDRDGTIRVAIDTTRRVTPREGIRVHRVRRLDRQVQWNASPPRVRIEDNTLALADRADSELEAIEVLTAAIGSRRTTVPRLREALGRRSRTRRRASCLACSMTWRSGHLLGPRARLPDPRRTGPPTSGRETSGPTSRRARRGVSRRRVRGVRPGRRARRPHRARGLVCDRPRRRPRPRRPRGRTRGRSASLDPGLRHAMPDHQPDRADPCPPRLGRPAARLRPGLRRRITVESAAHLMRHALHDP